MQDLQEMQFRSLGQEGGGHGNPLQYSCLENPMDRGASWATQSIGSQRVRPDWSDLACLRAQEGMRLKACHVDWAVQCSLGSKETGSLPLGAVVTLLQIGNEESSAVGSGFSSFSMWVAVRAEHPEIRIRDICAHASLNQYFLNASHCEWGSGSLFPVSVLGFGKRIWK